MNRLIKQATCLIAVREDAQVALDYLDKAFYENPTTGNIENAMDRIEIIMKRIQSLWDEFNNEPQFATNDPADKVGDLIPAFLKNRPEATLLEVNPLWERPHNKPDDDKD